jgi:hypothetical protein
MPVVLLAEDIDTLLFDECNLKDVSLGEYIPVILSAMPSLREMIIPL